MDFNQRVVLGDLPQEQQRQNLIAETEADFDAGEIGRVMWDSETGEIADAPTALTIVENEVKKFPGTPTRDLVLSLVSAASLALKEITNARDAKELGDRIGDIEILLKRRGAALAESNLISAQRLRTERYTGQLLSGTVSPGNPKLTGGRTLPPNINRNQSSNWQHMAEIPEGIFEQWLEEMISSEQEITTGAAMGVYFRYVHRPPQDDGSGGDYENGGPPDVRDYAESLMYRCPHCGQDFRPDMLIHIVIPGGDGGDEEF